MDLSFYKSRELVPLQCHRCTTPFEKPKNQIMTAIKHGRRMYCSKRCQHLDQIYLLETHCMECKQEFKPDKGSQLFCSQSCAASYNNRNFDRTTTGRCKCGGNKTNAAIECHRCKRDSQLVASLSQTLADVDLLDKGYKGSHRWNTVRKLARRVVEMSGREMKCEVCNFDAHVEVCHIDSIASFKSDIPLHIVNHPSNLRLLCPNHHWLLDNGHSLV